MGLPPDARMGCPLHHSLLPSDPPSPCCVAVLWFQWYKVGTHCLRRQNDKIQVWHRAGKKKRPAVGPHFKPEEEEQCCGEPSVLPTEGATQGATQRATTEDPPPYAGKPFRHCLRTEEGLACINTCIRQPDKLLWRQHYDLCYGHATFLRLRPSRKGWTHLTD